jgi:hypothetical protein
MTIGIGVLCCSSPNLPPGQRPDSIVMISDTMGSHDRDSTNELRKMYLVPEARVCAVCAGNVETGGEIISSVISRLPDLKSRTHGKIWSTLNEVVNGHRSERFLYDVLAPKYQVVAGKISEKDHPEIIRDFQQYDTGTVMLFGTFDGEGTALLYFVGRFDNGSPALVHHMMFPGHWSIGAGDYNANMWLNYRGQRLNFSVMRSLLHAYEACAMASSAPSVNQRTDIVIASAKSWFEIPYDSDPTPGSPVTLKQLRTMAKRYGPRSTDQLGFKTNQRTKAISS